jgi:YVTN family beta-propeller protein
MDNYSKRYLMYETNAKGGYMDYGEIVSIINDRMVNVNLGGQRNDDGSLVILEGIMIDGLYVPKIGDWVSIEWRNGQPLVVANNSTSIGLTNINDDVRIISSSDITNNVISAEHIRANSIVARHISAGTIVSEHISAGAITTDLLSANAITADKISGNSIYGRHIAGDQISGNHIAANTIDASKLTISAKTFGLLGQYFTYTPSIISGNTFTSFKGTRLDGPLDFDWGAGSPSIVGQNDNFSVRWQGFVFSPQVGQYTITVNKDANSTAKVVIDGTQVISPLSVGQTLNGTVSLEANKWLNIMVEYVQTTGNASFQLSWTKPDLIHEIIPQNNFTQASTVIDGSTILTGSIDANAIKVGTITAASAVIADAAIGTANIQNAAITSAKIGDAEIHTAHIATGNITTALIEDATITNAKVRNLDASKISSGFISVDRLAASSITGDKIQANTIIGDLIAGNTIEGRHIKAGTITAISIAAGSITGDRIAANTIVGNNIAAGSINAEHITTRGLDANIINVYNSQTGQVLIGGGYLRVDGLDVGVVQSDNLVGNGLFLTASSSYGTKRDNDEGEAILGSISNLPGSHEIWKVDVATGAVLNTLKIESKKPFDIAVDAHDMFAYATVHGDNSLVQIDLSSFTLTGKKLGLGTGPSRIIYTGDALLDHKHFFVLNSDPMDNNVPDSMVVIDAPPHSTDDELYVHHWIELGNTPYDIILDDNKIIYVSQSAQGDIAMIDASSDTSASWKMVGTIPIAAFMTDNYHGGLPGYFGLKVATGGDSSAAYDSNGKSTSSSMAGMDMGHVGHTHGNSGYGNPDGSIKKYQPQGIAQSQDADTLYVCDFINNELVIVDKYGNAPYNFLTGLHTSGNMGSGHMPSGGGMPGGVFLVMPFFASVFPSGGVMPPSGGGMSMPMGSGNSPASAMFMDGGGPPTRFVRYRIPIGDSPDFVTVSNQKVFISLQGSGKIAVINESDITNEINADRAFYGAGYVDPTSPMRPLPSFNNIRYLDVGSKPSRMTARGGLLFVTTSGQNSIVCIDIATETIVRTISVGPNPKGITYSNDGQTLYVVNHGGSGDLSFVYPKGPYIGDAYLGLEGGINLQGGEYWVPNRSDWVYDVSGNIQSYSSIEFRINEPFLNEGGYVRTALVGHDYQFTEIEQDIFNVINYSNGENKIIAVDETLIGLNTGNTLFAPRNPWIEGTNPQFRVVPPSGGGSSFIPSSNTYTVTYGDGALIQFSGGVIPSGGAVVANYTARNNLWFKPHNGSVLVAIENGSSQNFKTQFEIDEYVPKFVVYDNQQTTKFTPIADGINQEYTGIEYSAVTNRAKNMTVTASSVPLSGNLTVITDDVQTAYLEGDHTLEDMFPPQPYVTLTAGLQYVTVDLGNTYMIGSIYVSHLYEDGSRIYHNTKTQISEDGDTWYTVFDSSVSGEYNEMPAYHTDHGHTHFMHPITFPARPVRYIRDYANGWISGDGLTSGLESHWTDIKAFGDWQVEYNMMYPMGTEFGGQQVATNGRCVVTTDIQNAYLAIDLPVEFTTWWYMTYVVGPQFGKLKVEMPSMGGDHFLNLESPYINKIAHRHIMPFNPSALIKANDALGVKAGKHRAVIRQVSGKISIDRFRFEDFQYYTKNSLLVTSQSPATFTRYKIVAQQAKWYEGVGRQATEGAYDTPRTNPDSGLPDKSVPLKYRFRVKSQLLANGSAQERGIAYITSAIMETGKLSTHWRRSEGIDSIPSNRIQVWDANQPHNTGIQTSHIANGAIRGTKILPHTIMDYHISPYAKIEEYKINLNHPTHAHGRYIVVPSGGPMGTDLRVFQSNKDFLDSLIGFAGSGGQYGTDNTVARGNHSHPEIIQASHSHANKEILDEITGTTGNTYNLNNLHFHVNKPVLDRFSVAGSFLLWDGVIVGSGNTVGPSGGFGTGLSEGAVLTGHIRLADGTTITDSGYGILGSQIRSGTITDANLSNGINGNKLSSNSIIDISSGRITTGAGSVLGGNVSVTGDGRLFVGQSNGGLVVVRQSGGTTVIQLDGTNVGKLTGTKTYLDANGNGQFSGNVSANSLTINSTALVPNLNAEMINGIKESTIAKNLSIFDHSGKGVYTGLGITQQQIPNMTVQISGGVAYTDSGRRITYNLQSIALTTSSTTYDRIDLVYIRGSSAGANEGDIFIITGTPAPVPVVPTTPVDGVPLAAVTVLKNIGSILSANISDIRQYQPFRYVPSNNEFYMNKLNADVISSYQPVISINKPIKATAWATTLIINSGNSSTVWNHNFNLGNYIVKFSTDSPNRHVYWSNKLPNSVSINFDDAADRNVNVDVELTAY